MLERYVTFVMRRHKLVLTMVGASIVLCFAILSQARLNSSLGTLFFGENPAWQTYIERLPEFANDNIILVGYEVDAPLGAEHLNKLRTAVDTLALIDNVGKITSLLDAASIRGQDGGLLIENYADTVEENPLRITEMTNRLANDEFVRDLLISKDGHHAALVVEMETGREISGEAFPRIVAAVQKAMTDAGFDKSTLHRAGHISLLADVIAESYRNLVVLFPGAVLALFLLGWIVYRRLWPVTVTLLISTVADLWTIAFAVLLDRDVNLFISMVPLVIMVVGTADVIHLCNGYLKELQSGASKEDAILRSTREVGIPCLWTSATTFIGFSSLSFIPVPAFRQIGIVLGFGVAMALILALTIAPALFALLPAPRQKNYRNSLVMAAVDGFGSMAMNLVLRYPRRIIALFVLVFVTSLAMTSRLEVDTSFAARFPADHPAQQDARWFQKYFAGTSLLDVFVETDKKNGALNPELQKRIAKARKRLEADSKIDRAYALSDIIEQTHTALSGNPDAWPLSISAVSQELFLLEMGGSDAADALLDADRSATRIALRIPSLHAKENYEIAHRAQAMTQAEVGDLGAVDTGGIMYLLGSFLDDLIAGQKRGLLFAVLCIAFMMALATRSIRAGILSMIPNLLPLSVFGAMLVYSYDRADSDMFMLAVIAIGIGVDDTIHFLLRYRLEKARCHDIQTALSRTFAYAGEAIIITSLLLVGGFAVCAFSNYLTFHALGVFLPATLVVALLADLLMVPAMARLGWFGFAFDEE